MTLTAMRPDSGPDRRRPVVSKRQHRCPQLNLMPNNPPVSVASVNLGSTT